MRHNAIHIKESEGRGRGMFTDQKLSADLVIEVAPVIVMTAEDRVHLDKTLLHDYIFEWEYGCCMALGYVPIYNHSYRSNCEYLMDYETKTIQVRTVRVIEAGEELTINYNGDWDDAKPVWFEAG